MTCTEDSREPILIVEDEGLVAADLQAKLTHLGYVRAIVACSGEEALRRARATPFALALMDIRLPGTLDGIAAAEVLRSELDTPVVFLTAHSDADTVDRARRSEPFGYLLKPVTEAELRCTLQVALYKRRMEGRLLQAQRMEAVANLAAGLAHDFNNQLTLILGYAEQLAARLSGEDLASAVAIRQAGCVAAATAGQLLTLGRRERPRRQTFSLNGLIAEVQPLLTHALGEGRVLTTALGPLSPIQADRNGLKQALLNLALNARDAMPAGGELRIETSMLEIDAGSPAAHLYRPGHYVRLRVGDTGFGMDESTLGRIFEPFFTCKPAGAGTGLGLAMVHSIVVQSGGYIEAESSPGRGTTFDIRLPATVATSEAAMAAPLIWRTDEARS